MHRWYVKARYQIDHEERAKALECDYILEDTSSQVNPKDALPHVIIQVGRQQEQVTSEDSPYEIENLVFTEPVSVQELNAVPADDPYPESDEEFDEE